MSGPRIPMPVIGIVGGIGAGKSEVGRILQRLGCVVSDSDVGARAALEEDEVRRTLIGWWGPGVYDAAGRADRAAIGRIVFADASQRTRLEGVIHPRLKVGREAMKAAAEAGGARAFIIDAPLLFEAGLEAECDAVIFVDSPAEQRLARVGATRGWDEAEWRRRESAQLTLEEKRRRSGYAVANSTDRTDLERQVRTVLEAIIDRRSQDSN